MHSRHRVGSTEGSCYNTYCPIEGRALVRRGVAQRQSADVRMSGHTLAGMVQTAHTGIGDDRPGSRRGDSPDRAPER